MLFNRRGDTISVHQLEHTQIFPQPGWVEHDPLEIWERTQQVVAAALDIAHRTVAKIRQNLFWAFAYNVAGIPLAALGYLNPMVAGAAMALSSVSVMTNALLLKRWRL